MKTGLFGGVILFGDPWGIPLALQALSPNIIAAIVGASIRQEQHEALGELAKSAGVPLLVQPKRQSDSYSEFVSQIRSFRSDLILSVSYSMRLPEDLLSIPRLAAVNLHCGRLPEYRGANPIQWALLDGAKEIGVTLHYMTYEIDAGDVIAERRVPIMFGDTWLDILRRSEPDARELLAETVPKICDGTNDRRPQNESRAHRRPRRRPRDGRIDWDRSIRYIHNLVRALVDPLPGAFYETERGVVPVLEYLSVPSIACLKYGAAAGGRVLASDLVQLFPHPGDDSQMTLTIVDRQSNDAVGNCVLDGFDYDEGAADCRFNWLKLDVTKSARREALILCLEFVFSELELRRARIFAQGENPAFAETYDGELFRRIRQELKDRDSKTEDRQELSNNTK